MDEGTADDAADAVDAADAPGVDYLWVMQTTFVVTILAGAPVVAVLSAFVELPTWNTRATFAIRVGAVIWLLVALGVYAVARRRARRDLDE